MSSNPFDDETAVFFALVNDEEQYSLWPAFHSVPDGWSVAYGAPDGAPRQQVLDWIDETWDDMRPKTLKLAMRAEI